jgi:non-ribosomal peptide synthetase component F
VFGTPGRSVAPRLGARTGHEAVRITGGLVKRLEAFAREHNGTLFMSLLTGLNALLLLRTGRRDLCIATSMANRTHADTSGLVGPCENTVIIRSRLHDDLSFTAAFDHVRLKVLDAHARQELPFNILAERLAQEDGIDPASLIQVYFTLQNPLRQPLRLPGITVRSFGDVFREGQPALPVDQTWLSLMLKERPSGISGSLGYKADMFEADAAAEWVVDFGIMLERAIANPHAPLARLLARRAA